MSILSVWFSANKFKWSILKIEIEKQMKEKRGKREREKINRKVKRSQKLSLYNLFQSLSTIKNNYFRVLTKKNNFSLF